MNKISKSLKKMRPYEDFIYDICIDYFSSEEYVKKITFSVSRYGKHKKTLFFKKPISELKAIKKTEKYLSKPYSEKYYEKVKDDLFYSELSYEEAFGEFITKGDLLTDCIFLRRIIREENSITILCTS